MGFSLRFVLGVWVLGSLVSASSAFAQSLDASLRGLLSPVEETTLSTEWWVSEDEICEKPFEALCQTSDALKDAREKRVADMRKFRESIRDRAIEETNRKFGITDFGSFMSERLVQLWDEYAAVPKEDTARKEELKGQVITAFERYGYYVSEVRRQVFTLLSATGLNDAVIRARVREMADALASRLPSIQAFSEDPKLLESLQKSLADVGAFNQRHVEEGKLPMAFTLFFRGCGVDGLRENAFNYAKSIIAICPGFLLSYIDEKTDGLDFVVGHEVGHSIDYSKTPKAYEGYLACIDEQYGSDQFSTFPEFAAQEEKGLNDLRALLEKTKAEGKTKEAQIIQRVITDGEVSLKGTQGKISRYRNLSRVQTHAGELGADYWGTELLADRVEKLKDQDSRVRMLRAQLGLFCPSSENESEERPYLKILYAGLKTDGEHPRGSFRIKNAMTHPRIRASLGCKAKSEKKWCTIR